MIEVFKIVHNIYDRTTTVFLKLREDFVTRQLGRGHDLQLYQQRSQRNLRKYFFWFKGVSRNSLPLCVMGAQNVHTFKCRLDKHWECQAIKYDYRATLTGTGNRSLSQIE